MSIRSCLILLILCASPLVAQGFPDNRPLPVEATKSQVAAPSTPEAGTLDVAGKLLGGVAILGLLFGAFVYFARRNPAMRKMLGTSDMVRVLSRAHLGGKHALLVVKVGDRVLVLGSGAEGLRTLSEISDATEVSRLTAESQPANRQSFKEALKQSLTQPEDDSSQPVTRSQNARLAQIRLELDRITRPQEVA
ncbi:MAG: hypothetical protein BroJett014_09330 [Planctomycetota bacterium]|nr:hypothetical protein [Planctomycetota bacterium]NUQ34254.1 flagellar biosynthetic protein FliO [Planctomycetaceae bacterium]GIK51960.1 MAG: hypothetical protein BroJett014_09330 [Planctomycetota bacterium]